MPDPQPPPAESHRVLVKLRPSAALGAAESRADLRPLYAPPRTPPGGFGLDVTPRWFVAELPAGAASPWDLAHDRVADQLGVAEADVVFAEPDLVHAAYPDLEEIPPDTPFAAGENCEATPQDGGNGKAVGPQEFAWHLGDDFSQLAAARDAVRFTDPRTRIAHLDTGYFPKHVTTPSGIQEELQRNFVARDGDPFDAEDPDNKRLVFDNSGHGTGTLSVLAGRAPAAGETVLGGAPDAEIVPIRVTDSVVLLRTSALARAIAHAVESSCDVVSMSMGGLPTAAWAEAVDAAYEAGVCLVMAAGNHVGNAPPRRMVYPARFDRVIGVCGVMADGRPYADLRGRVIEGSFGPRSAMRSAIAAYTPNVPWAVFGCETVVRLNGQGTSAATPQVAAAAALWFEHYKGDLPRDWRRVEAVRHALFSSAKQKDDREHFGNGVLQARAALDVRPRFGLPESPTSSTSFAFLRLLTGLGIAETPPRERMFNLELAQRWLVNERLQEIVPDPEAADRLEGDDLRRLMEAVIEDPGASLTLRRHVAARYPVHTGRQAPRKAVSEAVVPEKLPACDEQPALADPPYRRVRVYAVDPSLSKRFDTAAINEVTLHIRWEKPKEKRQFSDYLEIDDVDADDRRYRAVDLDDPRLLAQDGWAPSEGNPQFHQQMIYAVAMKTIENFERALGRPVLWRPRPNPDQPSDDSGFVRRLAVRPHALHQANAYYSPQEVALLFGYFEVGDRDPGKLMPGSRVYTCLSHDIIVHETTHAILDGIHRRFNEPSNLDVLALHEGFADVVALLQHFTIPEVLENEIARTRGDIEAESILGSLAVQFGQATSGRGALRQAIGRFEDGVWKRFEPDPLDLPKRVTPHARGAVLVAAVFDAYLAIYRARVADLLRLASGGTGVLPEGAIHPDLVHRLAAEAAKSARHVLAMCIRALDYLPPVDVTFFEYLRALITADSDLVPDDRLNYRVAFAEAFRRRAIYPLDLEAPTRDTPRTLAVDTLRWQGLDEAALRRSAGKEVWNQYVAMVEGLKRYADRCLYLDDREELFKETRETRRQLHRELKKAFEQAPGFAEELGLTPGRSFEVHDLRRSMRISPDGQYVPQVIVGLTQTTRVRASKKEGRPAYTFRGGSTVVVDLSVPEVKYRIVKRASSRSRRQRTEAFVRETAADPLRALFFSEDRPEPFAALHGLADEGL